MKYYSLQHNSPKVSFAQAVIKGIAPDKGLYFPEQITPLSPSFFDTIETMDNNTIAYEAIKQFVGNEIPEKDVKSILTEVLSFDFPIVELNENLATLELFHGPTMAFKDLGARFMAQCLSYFIKDQKQEITVLVATSGDTGGAVAKGFLGVKGINVVILYPSGKVSAIQEKQLTTLGNNITALEVEGTFDDCQAMVKQAFLDTEIQSHRQLTSANSINVARWLPQLLYYFFAYKQLKHKNKKLVFSVPSGNFGNICAGIVAKKLGLPINHFIAATNSNDTVPQFLKTNNYIPKPSMATISNAMDVGDPSNFIRIINLYHQDVAKLKQEFSSYSFDDTLTKKAIHNLFSTYKYIADPHGAVGYLGLQHHHLSKEHYGVFLETAHPIKFKDIVEQTLNTTIAIPLQIQEVLHKTKKSIVIHTYTDLKHYLCS